MDGPLTESGAAGEGNGALAQRNHAGEQSHGGPIVAQVDLLSRDADLAASSADRYISVCDLDIRAEGPERLHHVSRILGDQGVFQEGSTLCQGGNDQGPLGIALGAGHAYCGLDARDRFNVLHLLSASRGRSVS